MHVKENAFQQKSDRKYKLSQKKCLIAALDGKFVWTARDNMACTLFVLPIFLVTHTDFRQDGIESGSLTAKTDSVWWQGWIELGKLLTQVFLLHLNGIWTGQVGRNFQALGKVDHRPEILTGIHRDTAANILPKLNPCVFIRHNPCDNFCLQWA